jgi:hypothetical protein
MLALGLSMALEAAAQGRHVSIIVDTSGSMETSDKPRYTLLLSQILADLLEAGDSLSVIRLPPSEGDCGDGDNPSLAARLNPADRNGFQAKLDKLLHYDTGNYFAAPVHTAQADLERHRRQARLLLFIADSGGLGNCDGALTQDLQALRNQGVMIAAINMGGPGAFDSNPAFSFTIGAGDSQELAQSVALVYQKFIGAKQVQTGPVGASIDIEISPLVKDAYLVVAADGPLPALQELAGNPGAAQIDLNHKGGGRVLGLDRQRRDYRIVHLRSPKPGPWRFQAPNLTETAGWMLLQDSALGLRLLSPPQAAQGMDTPLEFELYDQATGQRLASLPDEALQISAEIEGRKLALRDDGQAGDRQAGDGAYTVPANFSQDGRQTLRLNLQSQSLDRAIDLDIQVEKIDWLLQADLPERVEVDAPASLAVQARPNPASHSPAPVQTIEVYLNGILQASLREEGQNGGKPTRGQRYTGTWTPQKLGGYTLELRPVGGGKAQSIAAPIKVIGGIRFGPAIPARLGRTGSNSQLQGRLELGPDTLIKGEVSLSLGSDYAASGSVLEIDLGQGWQALNNLPLPLKASGPRAWPLRLRVGACPAGVDAADAFAIEITGANAAGQPLRHSIPLRLEIIADPWLHCWWPLLAALAAALLAALAIHGYWSPSRFSPKLGVVLSPEEDMSEGFFHAIHAQPGTGSGFYRDARAYIRPDFRLSGAAKSALARLRADGMQVYMRPESGNTLYRQGFDGEWEILSAGETPIHFGIVYKDAMGALYFELRNG